MKHQSVPIEMSCEFINITPLNPLISKCEIKVCYVSDEPNRNRSVITKEVAREMANSLPGSPIVGYYNETKGDFEEHNRIIDISGGQIKFKDTTRPYGFVDLNAKVWFQKFIDDGVFEREYLMTEGYLWTGQYPETQRVIEKGNNQSMELSNNFLDGTWTKDNNGNPKFFIINEAIISKLCILGEDQEPCFEGAGIGSPQLQFSFDKEFKEELFSMMKELKDLIKGGTPMITAYAVELGGALWTALYSYLEANQEQENVAPKYYVDSFWKEDEQKYVVLKAREDGKTYRLNFSWDETSFVADGEMTEIDVISETYEAFSLDAIAAYENEKYKKEDNSGQMDNGKIDNSLEGKNNFVKGEDDEEKCPKCGKPKSECNCENEDEEEKNKKKYSLEDIPEYTELQNKYSELEKNFGLLKEAKEQVDKQLESLTSFKAEIDRKEKQSMIDGFYMLSDEDKKDVIENIDTYSLDEIESKLSVICVRKKVSFNLEEEQEKTEPTTYSLNGGGEESFTPAWIKSLQSVAKDIDN